MPRLEAMVRAHAQEILCLKAHPLKGSFVTGGNDKRVRVWSLQSYELLATLEGHTEVRAGLYPTPNLTSNPHPHPHPRPRPRPRPHRHPHPHPHPHPHQATVNSWAAVARDDRIAMARGGEVIVEIAP